MKPLEQMHTTAEVVEAYVDAIRNLDPDARWRTQHHRIWSTDHGPELQAKRALARLAELGNGVVDLLPPELRVMHGRCGRPATPPADIAT